MSSILACPAYYGIDSVIVYEVGIWLVYTINNEPTWMN